jgi:hypothetical protein
MNMAYKLTVELSEDARARISDGFFNDPFSSGKATDQFCFCRGLPILSEKMSEGCQYPLAPTPRFAIGLSVTP